MNTTNVRWPDSLWAAVTPPGPDLPELIGTQQADVIVIGAGFTGLSTALHLREAGVDVAIVEAAEPGWGASGRNNGQVIPTLSRPDPEDIIAKHGAVGERFVAMLRDSASILFDVVQSTRSRPSTSRPAGFSRCIRRAASRSPNGACSSGRNSARRSNCCRASRSRDMIGSDAWYGGFWNKTGGHINPLALARGLARAVLGLGARIYARSPAISFERRNDNWIVKTEKGEISGRALVMATNAYSGEFSKSLVPRSRTK